MNLPLSGDRLWADLMEMAKIGGTPKGGCNRQALTDLDAEGRKLLESWCAAIGLTLSVDRFGNMGFWRPGRDPSRKPVAIGSHLDTQPTGGKFDGVLGVLTGLEVLRALHEAGVETEAPLLLINWTNEEGARFSPPMMGSGAAMGLFSAAETLARTDGQGFTFGGELARIGYAGTEELPDFDAYFEVHIEQGPVLERENLSVGVVTHALCQAWYEVTVHGEDAHGGSAMAGRRDAMVGAAELIAAIEGIALTTLTPAGEPGRATVGRLLVTPDSRNVVPSKIWFSVDMRHSDEEALAAMGVALRAEGAAIAARRHLEVEVEDFWFSPLVQFDPVLVGHVRDAARRLGIPHRDMPTAIGHDAVYVARKKPATMIFTPCHGGISHNEAESITQGWAEAALRVLAEAVIAAAGPK